MAEDAGRVPLRLRIGVTGHRTLRDESTIGARIDDILSRVARIADAAPDAPVQYEVVSPLGEGADRLVTERILHEPSSILEVPLPLAPEDYAQDFGSEASRRRFDELLARADRSWVVGGPSRVDAYRAAGEYVVNSCDLLIAIWDGQPGRGRGGTEDILKMARNNQMPIYVIGAEPPFGIEEERVPTGFRVLEDVERFDRQDVPQQEERAGDPIPTLIEEAGNEGRILRSCLTWVEPTFARAESIADRNHVAFVRTSRLVFLMSALATVAVALSVVTAGTMQTIFASLEVALMVGAFIAWLYVRRGLHPRWITARFLAERLRSAAFLAFVGSDDDLGSRPKGEYRGNVQEWLRRVVREVLRSRPDVDVSSRDLATVKDLLARAWLERQCDYYRERGRRHQRAYRALTTASAILLGTAIGSAALHALHLVEEPVGDAVIVLSIALPAAAAALIGIAALEQHHRHAERFELMARRLHELAHRLREARDLERVQVVALRIEAELRTEADAWIDVMRFQDVELPVG
jgi:hypothetical protein